MQRPSATPAPLSISQRPLPPTCAPIGARCTRPSPHSARAARDPPALAPSPSGPARSWALSPDPSR
eukprot:6411229-Prymnesium_polylepis.1